MPHRFPRPREGRTRANARYGRRHQNERAEAARRHQPSDPCARCGHPLGPMGRWLHYDHDEQGGYLGFSHGSRPCPWCRRRCNLRAGAQKGQRISSARRHRAVPKVPAGW